MSTIPATSSSSTSAAQQIQGSCEAASTTTASFGETSLDQVAQRVGIDSDVLLAANKQIRDPSNLSFGEVINVPAHEVFRPIAAPPPPAPPPPPVRRMEGLGVYQVDVKGGTRVVVEKEVVGASRPTDAEVKIGKHGDDIYVSHELRRGGHYAQLVTKFEGDVGDMRVTQRLYRWDAQARTMVDVTKEASRAGPLAVDWNMPSQGTPPGAGLPPSSFGEALGKAADTAKGMAAEMIIGEIPPSLVIPYVKDSILVEHFEFTPEGQHPYQHWSDTISRRWAATGERKTSFWYNKVVSVAGAAGSAASEANAVGKGMQNAAKVAKAAKLAEQIEARAAKAATHVVQDVTQDASKVSKATAGATHGVDGAAGAAKDAKATGKQLGSTDQKYWANTKPESPNPMAGRDGVKREVSDINVTRTAKKSPTGTDTPPAGATAGRVANDNQPIQAQKMAVGDRTPADPHAIKATGKKPPDEPRFLTSDPKVSTPANEQIPAKGSPASEHAPAKPTPASVPATPPPSHYGNWNTSDVMRRSPYKATQRDLYRGTVEEMADKMKAGKFNWAKSDVDPIILDANGKIMSGHHRIVAAKLAKVDIPESAIKRLDKVDTIRVERTWADTTLRPGMKPQ